MSSTATTCSGEPATPGSARSWDSSCSSDPVEQPIIIFDWDDTLLPTTYLKAAVGVRWLDADGPALPPDSPILAELQRHGQYVAAALRAARAVGRVAIVTLSERPWVRSSSERFFPGLGFQELLEELDVLEYYALEHVRSTMVRSVQRPGGVSLMLDRGIDVLRAGKRAAMSKCLRDICGNSQVQLNVVSIGDSWTEQNAIKDVLWSPRPEHLPKGEHLCKTVKLLEGPTLQQLGDQLRVLGPWLSDIVEHRGDIDLDQKLLLTAGIVEL